MIKITQRNLRDWLRIWSNKLHYMARGSTATGVHAHERNSFGHALLRHLRDEGLTRVILRLKVCLFVVNSYIGGIRLSSTEPLGLRIRLRNGLPAIIPLYSRNAIRAGNLDFIRIWASILNSYKGFLGTWELPSIESITQPLPDIHASPFMSELTSFISEFWSRIRILGGSTRPRLTVDTFYYSASAGPNHPNSVLGSGIDAYA